MLSYSSSYLVDRSFSAPCLFFSRHRLLRLDLTLDFRSSLFLHQALFCFSAFASSLSCLLTSPLSLLNTSHTSGKNWPQVQNTVAAHGLSSRDLVGNRGKQWEFVVVLVQCMGMRESSAKSMGSEDERNYKTPNPAHRRRGRKPQGAYTLLWGEVKKYRNPKYLRNSHAFR